jgi:hypothetical protein
MPTKICSKCGQEKDYSEFNKHSISKDGLKSWCRICSKEYNRKYYNIKENTDNKNKYFKKYYYSNKEKIKKHKRDRYKKDEKYRLEQLIRSAFYQFMSGNKKDSTFNILPYSLNEYKEHLDKTKKKEWIDCELHIDHIIPQSLYDCKNEEHIKKCWDLRNLRYLPSKDNESKNNKLNESLIDKYGIRDLLP